MYKLMVSHDCGCRYSCEAEREKLDDLIQEAQNRKLDEKWLRWVIEDEQGTILDASLIHKKIIAFMDKVNKQRWS